MERRAVRRRRSSLVGRASIVRRPSVGPSSASVGRRRQSVVVGQSSVGCASVVPPSSIDLASNLGEVGPTSAKFGPYSANQSRCRTNPVQTWQACGQAWPKSTEECSSSEVSMLQTAMYVSRGKILTRPKLKIASMAPPSSSESCHSSHVHVWWPRACIKTLWSTSSGEREAMRAKTQLVTRPCLPRLSLWGPLIIPMFAGVASLLESRGGLWSGSTLC